MLFRILATAAVGMIVLGAPASAQTVPGGPVVVPGSMRPGSTGDTVRDATAERAAASERAAREPRRRGPVPSPAEAEAGARAAIAAAGVQCAITGAAAVGQAGEDAVYEVSCADGPGRLVVAATPPLTFNCLALDVSIANGGDASSQCSLPANKDAVAAVAGYARALDAGCTVDEAAWIGRTPDDHDRYEIGCAAAEGYWLEVDKIGTPVRKIECLELARAQRTCAFTTAGEQIAAFSTRLADTPAAACRISAVRYAGGTDTHRYYEAACHGGEGVIVRFGLDGVFDRQYDCATASNVLGGCILNRPVGGG